MLKEIFYRACLECGHPSENSLPVCPDCLDSLEKYPFSCESCGFPSVIPAKICGKCRTKRYRDRIHIAYKYRGPVKKLIRDIKFSYRTTGAEAVRALADDLAFEKYDAVTDVPSHFTRRIRRFSHPALLLAKYIAKSSGSEYKKILKRTRSTEYQFKLRKTQRISNVKGAFAVYGDVRGLKILLVDDIITTGSTIEECSRILKKSGASQVDIFALAGGRS